MNTKVLLSLLASVASLILSAVILGSLKKQTALANTDQQYKNIQRSAIVIIVASALGTLIGGSYLGAQHYGLMA